MAKKKIKAIREQQSELRVTLLQLSEACPFHLDNTEDCPLFPLRKMEPRKRLQWVNALSESDLADLATYHRVCLRIKVESGSAKQRTNPPAKRGLKPETGRQVELASTEEDAVRQNLASNRQRTMRSKKARWQWIQGKVASSEEHMDLRFGDVHKEDDWSKWPLVARVSAPEAQVFRVEFLIQAKTPIEVEMIRAVEKQLTFFLVEKGEEDPWTYAQYQCGTGANVYSDVHWSFFPKGFEAGSESSPS